MPTPTPIPSSQVVQAVQAVQNTIDSAVQQGIVGVLLLLAASAVLISIGYAINAFSKRNAKPDNSGTNNLIESQSATLAALRAEFREERTEWRKLIEKRDENFIEAISHLSDSHNHLVDIQGKQISLETSINTDRRADSVMINAVKDDVGQILNVGSVPLRRLMENVDGYGKTIIETVTRIESSLTEIKTNFTEMVALRDEDKRMYQEGLEAITSDIEVIKRSLEMRIEEHRKGDTGEMKPAVEPEAPPLPVLEPMTG